MNAYEFIIKMKDLASSELRSMARSAGVADTQVDELNRSSGNLGNTMKTLKRTLATVFTVAALVGFTSKVVDARQEYERFDAVLTNTFQSADVGKGALNMLTDFAAKTPYQLNELTGSFVKLVNRGFTPTKNELGMLGDLAASQGKGFDQLSEAILDAETAEFERLKEFGIKAGKAGDSISLSFKGVTKTVKNNSQAIREAIMEYGEMDGVAGSMESISKTLGGRISNLKDQWWGFMVAVGGESGGIFNAAIDGLSSGIGFLTQYLPQISQWFQILWSYIEPVAFALWEFLKAALGFNGAGSAMDTFGSIMTSVLIVVDLFTTGLTTLIGWLYPFADVIGVATLAWAAFNLVVAISPVGWIVMGVMALITAIGIVIKYTKGWGDTWKFTTEGAKLIFEAFTLNAKAGFTTMINGLEIGLEMIKRGWYRFKESVGMGDSEENKRMIQQISEGIEERKKQIVDGYKAAGLKAKQAVESFGIKIDTEGMKRDFQALKDKFNGVGEKSAGTSAYDDYLANKEANAASGTPGGGDGTSKAGADTIVSGGTRRTEINITIQKLQDDTKIYVGSTEEGLSGLGEKVQEMLLRAVNSVNQMQTA